MLWFMGFVWAWGCFLQGEWSLLDQEVSHLVEQLGADEQGVRDQALAKLTSLSSAAFPQLRKLSESVPDVERQARVKEVIKQIAVKDALAKCREGKLEGAFEVYALSEGAADPKSYASTKIEETSKVMNSWFPEPQIPVRRKHDIRALTQRVKSSFGAWGIGALLHELTSPVQRLNPVPAIEILAEMGGDSISFLDAALHSPNRTLQARACSTIQKMTVNGSLENTCPTLLLSLRSLVKDSEVEEETKESAATILQFLEGDAPREGKRSP